MITNEENSNWAQSLFIGGFKDGHTQKMPLHDGEPQLYWDFTEYPKRSISIDFSENDLVEVRVKNHTYKLCNFGIPGIKVYCREAMRIEEVMRKLLDCYIKYKGPTR